MLRASVPCHSDGVTPRRCCHHGNHAHLRADAGGDRAPGSVEVDLLADTRKMSATVEDGKVLVNVDAASGLQTFALNDHCLGQISTDLEIPKRYFDRMRVDAPDLLTVNVNHWLNNEPKKRMLRGFRPEGGQQYGTGRAFVSSGYKRLDYIEIARNIFPVF